MKKVGSFILLSPFYCDAKQAAMASPAKLFIFQILNSKDELISSIKTKDKLIQSRIK